MGEIIQIKGFQGRNKGKGSLEYSAASDLPRSMRDEVLESIASALPGVVQRIENTLTIKGCPQGHSASLEAISGSQQDDNGPLIDFKYKMLFPGLRNTPDKAVLAKIAQVNEELLKKLRELGVPLFGTE